MTLKYFFWFLLELARATTINQCCLALARQQILLSYPPIFLKFCICTLSNYQVFFSIDKPICHEKPTKLSSILIIRYSWKAFMTFSWHVAHETLTFHDLCGHFHGNVFHGFLLEILKDLVVYMYRLCTLQSVVLYGPDSRSMRARAGLQPEQAAPLCFLR